MDPGYSPSKKNEAQRASVSKARQLKKKPKSMQLVFHRKKKSSYAQKESLSARRKSQLREAQVKLKKMERAQRQQSVAVPKPENVVRSIDSCQKSSGLSSSLQRSMSFDEKQKELHFSRQSFQKYSTSKPSVTIVNGQHISRNKGTGHYHVNNKSGVSLLSEQMSAVGGGSYHSYQQFMQGPTSRYKLNSLGRRVQRKQSAKEGKSTVESTNMGTVNHVDFDKIEKNKLLIKEILNKKDSLVDPIRADKPRDVRDSQEVAHNFQKIKEVQFYIEKFNNKENNQTSHISILKEQQNVGSARSSESISMKHNPSAFNFIQTNGSNSSLKASTANARSLQRLHNLPQQPAVCIGRENKSPLKQSIMREQVKEVEERKEVAQQQVGKAELLFDPEESNRKRRVRKQRVFSGMRGSKVLQKNCKVGSISSGNVQTMSKQKEVKESAQQEYIKQMAFKYEKEQIQTVENVQPYQKRSRSALNKLSQSKSQDNKQTSMVTDKSLLEASPQNVNPQNLTTLSFFPSTSQNQAFPLQNKSFFTKQSDNEQVSSVNPKTVYKRKPSSPFYKKKPTSKLSSSSQTKKQTQLPAFQQPKTITIKINNLSNPLQPKLTIQGSNNFIQVSVQPILIQHAGPPPAAAANPQFPRERISTAPSLLPTSKSGGRNRLPTRGDETQSFHDSDMKSVNSSMMNDKVSQSFTSKMMNQSFQKVGSATGNGLKTYFNMSGIRRSSGGGGGQFSRLRRIVQVEPNQDLKSLAGNSSGASLKPESATHNYYQNQGLGPMLNNYQFTAYTIGYSRPGDFNTPSKQPLQPHQMPAYAPPINYPSQAALPKSSKHETSGVATRRDEAQPHHHQQSILSNLDDDSQVDIVHLTSKSSYQRIKRQSYFHGNLDENFTNRDFRENLLLELKPQVEARRGSQ